ncbi:MAG: tetratricopeptide repeat protein, partial [Anaerolineales bacterium]|nr:tetratricopeptide repeat protein [Anaerolineales bacterium]
ELAERLTDTQLKTRLRHRLKTDRFLVILDDLPADWASEPILTELLTLLRPSKMLLTTRRYPDVGSLIHVHRMGLLGETDALQLLRHQAAAGGILELLHADDMDLRQIFQTVGGHPLALSLAARLCRLFPFRDLLSGWQGQPTGHFAETYRGIYEPLWRVLNHEQKQLLLALSFSGHHGAGPEYLARLLDIAAARLWPHLSTLIELCLVETRGSLHQRRYGVHSLTRQYLQTMWQDEAGQLTPSVRVLLERNLAWWASWAGPGRAISPARYDLERENLLAALRYSLLLPATASHRQAWLALARVLYEALDRGAQTTGAVGTLKELLPHFEGDPASHIQLLSYLGRIQQLLGQHEEAHTTFMAAAPLASMLSDPYFFARIQHDLATTYFHLRQFQRAQQYANAAASAYNQLSEVENSMAGIENLLGSIAKDRGEMIEAQKHYEKAIALWRNLRSTHNLVRSLNNLAQTVEQLGQVQAAAALYDEALSLLAHYHDPRDQTLILLSLGTLHYNQGHYDDAADAFARIDSKYLQQAGLQEYQALVLNNRGNIAFVQGQFEVARARLEEAAGIWRQLDEAVRLANSLSRLGDVFQALADNLAAAQAYEEAIRLAGRYPEDARARQILAETESDLARLQGEMGGGQPPDHHPEKRTDR